MGSRSNLAFRRACLYIVRCSNRDSNSTLRKFNIWDFFEMARAPVLAAGGIVLRRERTPRIAVVRLRKRNEWVLPKGKLDAGETPRDAAEREVLEETGHDVSVHEFLGTLVYETGGRSKIVHYWRMEADGEQIHELMGDVRSVDRVASRRTCREGQAKPGQAACAGKTQGSPAGCARASSLDRRAGAGSAATGARARDGGGERSAACR
jgi:8-oxo-dGTP pyrophosphatase MutT (NUDIX family)